MAKTIVLDELHVTVTVPSGLPEAEYAAMRRALHGSTFMAELRRSVRSVVGSFPALATVRVVMSR